MRWWDALNAAIRLADGAKVERNAGVTLGYAEPFFRALTGINFIKAACREISAFRKGSFWLFFCSTGPFLSRPYGRRWADSTIMLIAVNDSRLPRHSS